ncbi:transposase [Ferroplasma acidiphilum]|uniref:transposase n=1 Tax=Ferroplasma acidiphilum TaxID=74969 RepID=UPI002815D850|nr:transposase [Ferroplasma acidiphilum]WMT53055.1 MAG: transposase [Ferroplasma acidiphilum]
MPSQQIPLIMEIIDKIVSPDDRKRKYTDRQIVKLLIVLQIFNISYRSARIFLTNHEEYIRMAGLNEIPSFQTLSRRARMIDLHAVNNEITYLYSIESIAAIDSFIIHTCKHSTAMRRKAWNNYKDPVSGWSKTTRGWSYGRKCHMAIDVDSLIIMEWFVTKGNMHDSHVSHDMVDSVRDFSYVLADSAYDASDIYDYVFENTHALPIIDTNKRRGIVDNRLPVNRKIGIDFRKEYASMYPLRWEIERTFSILEEILKAEYIWYTVKRDYDTAIGLKAIAYNLMVISNMELGEKPREIMKIVNC